MYNHIVAQQLQECQARIEDLEGMNKNLGEDNGVVRQQYKDCDAELKESQASTNALRKQVAKHERRIETLECELRRLDETSDLLPKEPTQGQKLGGIVMPKMKLSATRGPPPPGRRMPAAFRSGP